MRNLTWIFLFTCATAAAQPRSKDTVVHVFNQNLLATTSDKAVFTGYAVKNGDRWSAILFNDQTKLVARGSYASKKCSDKQGWFTFYYADGSKAASGQYHRDLKQGNWRIWHTNGQLRDSIEYDKDRPDGQYYTYFEDGTLSGKGVFKDGVEDGTWIWYHPNGQQSSVEEYVKGKLEGQQCFDAAGRKQLNQCKLFAEPANLQNLTIRQRINEHPPLPKDASGKTIEGLVTISIHIDSTGLLKEFLVLKADHPLLDSLAKQMFSEKQWKPAYNHNRAVSFQRIIQVPFYKDKRPNLLFANAENGSTGNDGRMPELNTGKSAVFRDPFGIGSY